MQKRMRQREGNRRVRVNFRANSYPVKIATLPPILVWVRNRLRLALGGLVALIPIFLVSQRWLASCCCTPCSLGQALVHLANPLSILPTPCSLGQALVDLAIPLSISPSPCPSCQPLVHLDKPLSILPTPCSLGQDLQFKVHLKENQQLKHLNSGSEHPQACYKAIPNGANQRLAKLTTRTPENESMTINELCGKHAKAF